MSNEISEVVELLIESFLKLVVVMLVCCLICIPLAIWKLAELILWIFN